jgi:hypothetical protein
MIRLSEVTGRFGGPTLSPTMPVGDEHTDDDFWDALGIALSIQSKPIARSAVADRRATFGNRHVPFRLKTGT